MTDKIFIRGLSLHAHHGVLPYEGKVGQSFTIDLMLEIDLSTAARTDKVADTVSYDQAVADIATEREEGLSHYRLRVRVTPTSLKVAAIGA